VVGCASALFIPFVSHARSDSFLGNFLGAHLIFLGPAWAEGKGELATCSHRADSGQRTADRKRTVHNLAMI